MPYSKFHIAFHYFQYYLNADSWRTVQSPFNYKVAQTICDDEILKDFKPIEKRRKTLLKNKSSINVIDFGKGAIKSENKINVIAKKSLKSKKYARLLYRLVKLTNASNILELGTSFGISSAYMAIANKEAKVITIEGSESIAKIAQEGFNLLDLKNIHQVIGSFENTLTSTLNYVTLLDIVFIDGHHQKKATINYFEQCLTKSHSNTVFIFDDINWSDEMKSAWNELKNHKQTTLTIDLFMMGLLFVNPGLSKQNIILRY